MPSVLGVWFCLTQHSSHLLGECGKLSVVYRVNLTPVESVGRVLFVELSGIKLRIHCNEHVLCVFVEGIMLLSGHELL